MREKYYTRAGIQAPRFSRSGAKIGGAVSPSSNFRPEGRGDQMVNGRTLSRIAHLTYGPCHVHERCKS